MIPEASRSNMEFPPGSWGSRMIGEKGLEWYWWPFQTLEKKIPRQTIRDPCVAGGLVLYGWYIGFPWYFPPFLIQGSEGCTSVSALGSLMDEWKRSSRTVASSDRMICIASGGSWHSQLENPWEIKVFMGTSSIKRQFSMTLINNLGIYHRAATNGI